ncbi:acetyltransferase [Secundilactobacillus paracollinoides]|uniref:Acetyltransferase n=1 Tax=Secundilactobacillus paracollinoides TaxID=240427 RepID=A0A1B2IY39_9LACO|nr:acetyltransferase [Secundilactobacillus paracollinoides]ANZ65447.1 acetyltransferase [Secundilactobacillus paracollinoides]ANZ66957.1 acetyltransferase [Secundilactobacillus paracollinoides]
MQFKKIENADVAEKLTSLLHQAYAADVRLGIHFAASSVTVENVRKHIESTPTFILEDDDGTIVATTSVRLPWSDNPSPFGLPHLGWVATNPDYQQQGFSKQIISWVVTNYVKPELYTPAVTIGTAADHPWLLSFYKSLGFKVIDITQKPNAPRAAYLISIFDEHRTRLIDDAYLQKTLSKQGLSTY